MFLLLERFTSGFQGIVRHAAVTRSTSEPEEGNDDGPDNAEQEDRESGESQEDAPSDNQTLLRLLEQQEKVSSLLGFLFIWSTLFFSLEIFVFSHP